MGQVVLEMHGRKRECQPEQRKEREVHQGRMPDPPVDTGSSEDAANHQQCAHGDQRGDQGEVDEQAEEIEIGDHCAAPLSLPLAGGGNRASRRPVAAVSASTRPGPWSDSARRAMTWSIASRAATAGAASGRWILCWKWSP